MSHALHTTIWNSYFPDETSYTPQGGKRAGPRTSTLASVLATNRDRIPKALLGIAVWNQVPRNNLGSTPSPLPLDPALVGLLQSVLDLAPDKAVSMRDDPAYDPFPPYPDRIILDSKYVPQNHPGAAQATLELCIPTPPDHVQPSTNALTTFDQLKTIANPHSWTACDMFWSNIKGADLDSIMEAPQSKRWMNAQLHLPGKGNATSVSVRLNIVEWTRDNPLRAHISFSMAANALIKLCRGTITVQKEPGRPGAARVINERLLQFTPEAGGLAERAAETLKYWLQAETLTLVDSILRRDDA